ncbi:DUF4160 domain-containing protein [Desulfocurvus sp. DL9XJH121]
MTTITKQNNYRIEVRANDHQPPHFHITAAEWAVVVSIETWEITRGNATPEARKAVNEAKAYADVIYAVWKKFHGRRF